MSQASATARKLGGLSLAPFVVSVASILSIPLIVMSAGPSVLVSIAVGQAAGDIARAFVSWSWNTVGLSQVAAMTPREQVSFYFKSLPPRLCLLVPASVALAVFVFLWPLEFPIIALISALSGAVFGLNGTWLFIAAREPKLLILCNSIPRAIFIVLGAMAVLMTKNGIYYPIGLLVGNLAAAVIPTVVAHKRARILGMDITYDSFRAMVDGIRKGVPGFVVDFIMAARMSAPMILAPLVFPAGAPAIAIAERVLRWVNTGLTPVMQFLQTGIPNYAGNRTQQGIKGIRRAWGVGIPVGVVVFAVAPLASVILSAGSIHLDWFDAAMLGVISGAIFAGTVVGNGTLVHFGKVGIVAMVVAVGLILLLITTFLVSVWLPEKSTLLGFMAAEIAIACTSTTIALVSAQKLRAG